MFSKTRLDLTEVALTECYSGKQVTFDILYKSPSRVFSSTILRYVPDPVDTETKWYIGLQTALELADMHELPNCPVFIKLDGEKQRGLIMRRRHVI
jgi:hypothetical protein